MILAKLTACPSCHVPLVAMRYELSEIPLALLLLRPCICRHCFDKYYRPAFLPFARARAPELEQEFLISDDDFEQNADVTEVNVDEFAHEVAS